MKKRPVADLRGMGGFVNCRAIAQRIVQGLSVVFEYFGNIEKGGVPRFFQCSLNTQMWHVMRRLARRESQRRAAAREMFSVGLQGIAVRHPSDVIGHTARARGALRQIFPRPILGQFQRVVHIK